MLGGEELAEDPAMVKDALCELANMLGGAVKQRIDTSGVHVEISLPTLLQGAFSVADKAHNETTALTFDVGGEMVETTLVYNRSAVPG